MGQPVYARLGYRDLGPVQMWERRAALDSARHARRRRDQITAAAIEGLPIEPCNVARLRAARARALSEGAYGYFAGGAGDERTLRENVEAYARWRLRPRALVDVSEATTATTVLGTEVSMPLLVAPVAFQRMAHPDGEAGHGARGRGGRHDHGAVDARDRDARRGRARPRPARPAGSSSTASATAA